MIKYLTPEMEVFEIETEDLILASIEDSTDTTPDGPPKAETEEDEF